LLTKESDHIYYTLLWQVLGFAVPFTSLSKLCKYAGLKPFCGAKPACCDFSSSNFYVQGHILSTTGDALRSWARASFISHKASPVKGKQWSWSLSLLVLSSQPQACWNIHPASSSPLQVSIIRSWPNIPLIVIQQMPHALLRTIERITNPFWS